MASAFEKLRKILKLEQDQAFKNTAVIGGMEKFVNYWHAEASQVAQSEEERARVEEIAALLRRYGELEDRADREQTWQQAFALAEQAMAAAPCTPPAEPVESTPATPPPSKLTPTVPAPSKPTPTVPSPSKPTPASPPPSKPGLGLEAPVSTLPGISTAYTKRLARLGIETVNDLLYHVPHRYDDYRALKTISQLEYGEETTIMGVVWETRARKSRGGTPIITSILADASGTIEATWFNQPYLERQLKPGRRIVLSGKVDEYLGRLVFQSPTWEPLQRELIHTGRLVPIYPLTAGVTSRWLRRLMKRTVDYWAPRLPDPLPEEIRERHNLLDLPSAIRQIHFPDSQTILDRARYRLSFDEFLLIQLAVLSQRYQWQQLPGQPIPSDPPALDVFLQALPFELTAAQRRTMDDIVVDLAQPQPMRRLLQGDVGSGKTVVAAAAILMAARAGRQSAIMAPTEILAEQHYRSLVQLFSAMPGEPIPTVYLLTGGQPRAERTRSLDAITSGEADVVVGTHALIQQGVDFDDLALAIVDEQHRFGVAQRTALRDKAAGEGDTSASPHLLVMSATPIPRSLALTLYGDLDLSVIDELPPGRQPIRTRWLLSRERERAYTFVRSQVEEGRQAFILCPLVEGSDKVQARAAVDEHARLQEAVFPDLRVGLLHGRMRSKNKESVMTSFYNRELDILVSTSVVEVGIDVPNASVILIEGADRFGLAQLHQFRGRVGRGEHPSYCLLVSDAASPDDPGTRATWERLKAIEETQDGFVLAEKDLELRGPGEFMGVRQSGLPDLRMGRLSDTRTIEKARQEARRIFDTDPELQAEEHAALAAQVDRFWDRRTSLS
jgi:ATP-dependent DNA helicase RecG